MPPGLACVRFQAARTARFPTPRSPAEGAESRSSVRDRNTPCRSATARCLRRSGADDSRSCDPSMLLALFHERQELLVLAIVHVVAVVVVGKRARLHFGDVLADPFDS